MRLQVLQGRSLIPDEPPATMIFFDVMATLY
jgi:hypothetical protein